MMQGAQQVLDAFDRFERLANGRGGEAFAYELKTSVIREIVRGRHIDTTRLIRSVNYHRDALTSSGPHYRVDASSNPDVFYDGYLEFPRKNWRGAYVYQKGIQGADFQRASDDIAREAFA